MAERRKVPGWYETQRQRHGEVIAAYESLGRACRTAGPLDGRTAALVKLGIAVGSRLEGAVHSHVRRSLEAGASPDACRHVVLLATTTIGFPAMMAALSWVEDVAAGRASGAAGRRGAKRGGGRRNPARGRSTVRSRARRPVAGRR
jgi:alkylhydroperoxidase/carboxymuconolactone decarboxylase family protein YurZ